MSDTSNVLDLIDGAIEDCALSDDAMRWTPNGEPAKPADRVTWVPPGGIADLAAPTIAELSGGINLTPYIGSIATAALSPPPPVTYHSIMEVMRSLTPPRPRPAFVCSTDDYDRIKAALDERGVEVDLTASPYVASGTVIRHQPADYVRRIGLALTEWQERFLTDAFRMAAPARVTMRLSGTWQGIYEQLDEVSEALRQHQAAMKRERMRYLHRSYRAKTRNRNRRSR